ncbi:MAG: hypothetical protein AAF502_01775 [Bacteroidota bacterium]
MIRFKLYHTLVLLIVFVGLSSCKLGDNEKQQPESNAETGLPEGFDDFYKRFHRDSLYQIDHITFPLQGVEDFADTIDPNAPFYWERDEWIMHREIDLEEKGFNREIKALGYMVEETIRNADNFGTIRRFYFADGEWNLVYYVGINPLARQ